MEKQVIWSGAVLDPSGYGEASRNYVLGLARHGELKLHVRPRYFWSGDTPDLGMCGPRPDVSWYNTSGLRHVRSARIAMTKDGRSDDIYYVRPT